jgi:hypothetical protein
MGIVAIRTSGRNQEYEVRLGHGDVIPSGEHGYWPDAPHVSLRFSIPKFGGMVYYGTRMSERFFIPIEPGAFASLALEMVRADPAAAIKAFGAALQTVDKAEIEKTSAAA